jgi:hypothetical protein
MGESWMERATRLLRDAHAQAERGVAEEALITANEAREALLIELGELPDPMVGDLNIDTLRQRVQSRYRAATEHDTRPKRTVPDFREHEGMKVTTYGRFLTDEELAMPSEQLARALVEELLAYEQRALRGRPGAPRCFLDGHELPTVLRMPADGKVKLRHNFGTVETGAGARD